MPLPRYEYPGNAMLNFDPLASAIKDYGTGMTVAGESAAKINAGNAMARGDWKTAQAELAKVDPRAAMEAGMYPTKKAMAENELEQSTRKLLGAQFQAGLTLPPEQHGTYLKALMDADPRYASGFKKMGIDPLANPTFALKAGLQDALGAQDPEDEARKVAQTKLFNAEANKAGYINATPGTSVVKLPDAGGVPALTPDMRARAQGEALPGGATEVFKAPLKPSPNHQWINPNDPSKGEVPIPGGPADVKYTEAKHSALTRVEAAETGLQNLVGQIEGIERHPGLEGNFGVIGKLPNWPGGQSAGAWARIEQLKARGGFNELQAMRDASKTGGALGNVSNAEGARLENAFGRLQTSQSPEDARAALSEIKLIAAQASTRMRQAYERQYGQGTPGQTPTRNAPGEAISGPAAGETTPKLPAIPPPDQIPTVQPDQLRYVPPHTYYRDRDGNIRFKSR